MDAYVGAYMALSQTGWNLMGPRVSGPRLEGGGERTRPMQATQRLKEPLLFIHDISSSFLPCGTKFHLNCEFHATCWNTEC